MPVIAIPAANPAPPCCNEAVPVAQLAAVSVLGQNVLSAPVSTHNGRVLLTRMRSVRIIAGQHAKIDWQLHDRDGNPVNLTEFFPAASESSSEGGEYHGYSMKMRLREHLSMHLSARCPVEYDVAIVEAATGKVQVTIPKGSTKIPGVYFGEIAVLGIHTDEEPTSDEHFVVFSNTFYVLIESGQWQTSRGGVVGPPTIAEIRLHLRDSDGAESHLLDNLKFDDAEIALAISRPVMEWNETPPPVGCYTTQTFPHRFMWLEAICGNLFLMAAEQFRANNLQYSAAGVSVNDQDKEPNYEKAADRRLTTWRQMMRAMKASVNLEQAYGGIGSSYGRIGGNLY